MTSDNNPTVPNILFRFADLLETQLSDHRLDIPEKFGNGYCMGFVFNQHIRMLISDYELNQDILVKQPMERITGRVLFFKLQNIFPKSAAGSAASSANAPSVLIATSRVNTDDVFAIHSNTETINIEVDALYLSSLFGKPDSSPVLQSLLEDVQPLLFEQLVSQQLQRIVTEIITEPVNEPFRLFYLRVKAEELVCRLLMELNMRQEKQLYPVNDQDIRAIYRIKTEMLDRLDQPPLIGDLAKSARMSPTKLKRLFKQVFGNSIFNYYQASRMQEAARLLKQEKLSVADTGYRLGFTNLSHFSKIFCEHIGMKPKRYSRS